MQRITRLIFVLWLLAAALPAAAGSWAQLPDAVAQLQTNPGSPAALEVVRQAGASVRAEAVAGRLHAVATLMEVYSSLVTRLPDGDRRLRMLEIDVARALVSYGKARREQSFTRAATAWTMAASYDPTGEGMRLVREILLPPAGAEPGDAWRSPLDGAELLFLPAETVRVGCSETDRRCRQNEIFFRWVEMRGFWIETVEVTNARYRLCVEAGGCSPPLDGYRFNESGIDDYPVVGLTWNQARDYASWAGRRLPSEAAWERAARASDPRWRFPWGNARRSELANVWSEAQSGRVDLAPVASYPPSVPGLYDLAGNVWEWCADRYQPGLKQLPNDGAPVRQGIGRSARGGSWRRSIDLARVSTRTWFDEWYRADDMGFRCVMPRAEDISDRVVLAAARSTFGVDSRFLHDLSGVSLSTEDRRYLDRRAITWLLLEERSADALRVAVSLFQRDPNDPVALGVLNRIGDTMDRVARAGDLEMLDELRTGFALAAAGSSRFDRRRREIEPRLASALKMCGETAIREARREKARSCFEKALEISPNDPALRRGLEATVPKAGETRISKKDGREMVWVPSGSFHFGASEGDSQASLDEFPAAEPLLRGYWIDRTEVTNEEYRRCVDAGACSPPAQTDAYDDPNRASHPVLWVNWYQARDFAKWAGKRLPTEMEWERAARAGSTERFPWGARWDQTLANGMGTEGADHWGAEAPVGRFPANAWGIVDLVGNAAEWVQDVYHNGYTGAPRDGRPWEQEYGGISERQRVVRGGYYADPPSKLRVSRRSARRPDEVHRGIGFRCASD